jgi:LCP family protein required for cell wall assembly
MARSAVRELAQRRARGLRRPPGVTPPVERPPREGLRFLLRASLALVLIVVLTAGATATAALLKLEDVLVGNPADSPPPVRTKPGTITVAKPGKPQTLLILGSDRRYSDLKKNNPLLTRSNPARSDTILLVRLDPDQEATAVLSIPRDLKVFIPGHGYDKINAAYSYGGPDLTAQTVKQLLGGITINHIVNINFQGFRQAVNAVGCIYADVDRRYYHSNLGLPVSQRYAEIDIQPGYQRLCGQRALDYVRFRHADSDIVRAARQQDFLRAAKDQINTSSLLGERDKLIKIFRHNTQTDTQLRTLTGVLKLAKLALFSAGHPVTQIRFPAIFAGDATNSFVEASDAAVKAMTDKFLHATAAKASGSKQSGAKAKKSKPKKISMAALRDARRAGEDLVATTVAQRRLGFALYFPRYLTSGGRYATATSNAPSPRVYTLRDRAGHKHRSYRLVVTENQLDGLYYGIQGTTWKTPPSLSKPTSTRRVHGRNLLLFKDGSRLRFVAWRQRRALYWVSNTLGSTLSNDQMLGIAASLVRLK